MTRKLFAAAVGFADGSREQLAAQPYYLDGRYVEIVKWNQTGRQARRSRDEERLKLTLVIPGRQPTRESLVFRVRLPR